MSERVQRLLSELSPESPQQSASTISSDWISSAADEEADELLRGLTRLVLRRDDRPADAEFEPVLASLARRQFRKQDPGCTLNATTVEEIAHLYEALGRASKSRHHLLCILAASGGSPELARFAELVTADPPTSATLAAVPFLTLLRRPDRRLRQLFPRLLDGLQHLPVAAAILDLSNYLMRSHIVDEHPAAARSRDLIRLLDGLVDRLAQVQEAAHDAPSSSAKVREQVVESISLAISLSDAIALIGDASAVATLSNMMELGHRRLQVEAAGALARLKDERGEQRLAGLTAEPAVRLRALAYADELGLLDQMPTQFRSPVARAEAELVSWLSAPTAMGISPTCCELVDSREQYWPGLTSPVACYLFRFTYQSQHGTYSNVGIAGPMVHCFTADLTDLPPDDIYAAYAGWQAEHEEIADLDISQLSKSQLAEVNRLQSRLVEDGYDAITPLRLGRFFGEKVLMAAARKRAASGIAVVDSQRILWYPTDTTRRPLGPLEAYSIYKGRKLLKTFNP